MNFFNSIWVAPTSEDARAPSATSSKCDTMYEDFPTSRRKHFSDDDVDKHDDNGGYSDDANSDDELFVGFPQNGRRSLREEEEEEEPASANRAFRGNAPTAVEERSQRSVSDAEDKEPSTWNSTPNNTRPTRGLTRQSSAHGMNATRQASSRSLTSVRSFGRTDGMKRRPSLASAVAKRDANMAAASGTSTSVSPKGERRPSLTMGRRPSLGGGGDARPQRRMSFGNTGGAAVSPIPIQALQREKSKKEEHQARQQRRPSLTQKQDIARETLPIVGWDAAEKTAGYSDFLDDSFAQEIARFSRENQKQKKNNMNKYNNANQNAVDPSKESKEKETDFLDDSFAHEIARYSRENQRQKLRTKSTDNNTENSEDVVKKKKKKKKSMDKVSKKQAKAQQAEQIEAGAVQMEQKQPHPVAKALPARRRVDSDSKNPNAINRPWRRSLVERRSLVANKNDEEDCVIAAAASALATAAAMSNEDRDDGFMGRGVPAKQLGPDNADDDNDYLGGGIPAKQIGGGSDDDDSDDDQDLDDLLIQQMAMKMEEGVSARASIQNGNARASIQNGNGRASITRGNSGRTSFHNRQLPPRNSNTRSSRIVGVGGLMDSSNSLGSGNARDKTKKTKTKKDKSFRSKTRRGKAASLSSADEFDPYLVSEPEPETRKTTREHQRNNSWDAASFGDFDYNFGADDDDDHKDVYQIVQEEAEAKRKQRPTRRRSSLFRKRG